MIWYFIGVYIINRTLHGRLEIRNFSSRVEKYFTRSPRSLVKYFSTLEENFRISARSCNILYISTSTWVAFFITTRNPKSIRLMSWDLFGVSLQLFYNCEYEPFLIWQRCSHSTKMKISSEFFQDDLKYFLHQTTKELENSHFFFKLQSILILAIRCQQHLWFQHTNIIPTFNKTGRLFLDLHWDQVVI